MATSDRALFQPVRRSRLYEGIVRQIQDLIADKHLQPGAQLPGERELAEVLFVSRASVREALRVLDYIGVVDARAGEGTFVATSPPTPIDPSVYSLLSDRTFLLDLVEARRIFEEGVVELAALNATREDLEMIDQFLITHESALEHGKASVADDLAFHALVAEATGNPVLLSVMRHLNELWLQARERTGRRPTSPYKAHRFHRQMLGALRRHQPAAGRRALRNHLQDMRADILAELPEARKRGTAETRKTQKRKTGGSSDGNAGGKDQNRA